MKKCTWTLLLVSILLLAACGMETDAPSQKEIYYAPEAISFSSESNRIEGSCASGDSIYLLGQAEDGLKLLRQSSQGGEAQELPDFQSVFTGKNDTFIAASLRPREDGTLWVMERGLLISDTYEIDPIHVLYQLDGEGKELARFEYHDLDGTLGLGTVMDLLVDGDGDIFAVASGSCTLLDETGAAQFTLETNAVFAGDLIRLGDGSVGMAVAEMTEPGMFRWSLRRVDKEKQDWGEAIPLTEETSFLVTAYGGGGDALFYYTVGDSLYIWRKDAQEGSPVVDLLNVGLSNFRTVSALSGGQLVLLSGYGADVGEPCSLTMLVPSDEPPLEKKVLTLASLQLTGDLQQTIIAFNQSSTEYRIDVTDYAQYGDRAAAMTRLATEIGSGKIPDLIDLYSIPVARWAANDLLEDLWPYIDSDPELGRDALMERVLEAAEIDGKLYEASQYFYFSTLTGAKSVVGDRMTWTGADMWEALEAMPEDCIPLGHDQTGMLESLMELDWSRFVDWDTGACNFTCDEFRSLLEFCAGFPEDARGRGDQGIYEKRQMLMTRTFSDFTFPQVAKFLLGGEISYVGYPNEWGEVGSSFGLSGGAAMFSTCQDKEGAWAFLRTLLLPHDESELQYGFLRYFPINKADFQKAAELAMTPEYLMEDDGSYCLDIHGEKIPFARASFHLDWTDEPIRYYAIAQEDYDQIMALYNAIDAIDRWDQDLGSIITEVAGAYFAGDKSLDETVELIQNRATLYVNEQT